MIYIPPTVELSMVGVLEAGIPNRERVCLRPTDTLNLAQFGILAARKDEAGFVTPLDNLFFWFGELKVAPPAWIIVLTGKGERPTEPLIENGTIVHLLYWNLENTIFQIPGIVPVLFKFESVLIGHNILPPEKRQIETPTRSLGNS